MLRSITYFGMAGILQHFLMREPAKAGTTFAAGKSRDGTGVRDSCKIRLYPANREWRHARPPAVEAAQRLERELETCASRAGRAFPLRPSRVALRIKPKVARPRETSVRTNYSRRK